MSSAPMIPLPIKHARDRRITAPDAGSWPRISENVQRFAAQLHSALKSGPHVVMITPASRAHSSLRLAYDTALALVKMNEAPVLVMDLESSESCLDLVKTPVAADTLIETYDPDERLREQPARTAGLPALSVFRPVREGQAAAEFLSSPKFALVLAGAKRSFSRVLVAADCVLESVGAVVAANLCDAVVLLVKGDATTTTMLKDIKQILQRNNAKLLGFIYEKR